MPSLFEEDIPFYMNADVYCLNRGLTRMPADFKPFQCILFHSTGCLLSESRIDAEDTDERGKYEINWVHTLQLGSGFSLSL